MAKELEKNLKLLDLIKEYIL